MENLKDINIIPWLFQDIQQKKRQTQPFESLVVFRPPPPEVLHSSEARNLRWAVNEQNTGGEVGMTNRVRPEMCCWFINNKHSYTILYRWTVYRKSTDDWFQMFFGAVCKKIQSGLEKHWSTQQKGKSELGKPTLLTNLGTINGTRNRPRGPMAMRTWAKRGLLHPEKYQRNSMILESTCRKTSHGWYAMDWHAM